MVSNRWVPCHTGLLWTYGKKLHYCRVVFKWTESCLKNFFVPFWENVRKARFVNPEARSNKNRREPISRETQCAIMAATKALLWIAEELFSEGWRTVYLTSLNNNSLEVDCVLVRFCPKIYSFVPRNHFTLCGLQTEMLSIQQLSRWPAGLKNWTWRKPSRLAYRSSATIATAQESI